jgi:hypothetical protein
MSSAALARGLILQRWHVVCRRRFLPERNDRRDHEAAHAARPPHAVVQRFLEATTERRL